jgi:hypothetical protein
MRFDIVHAADLSFPGGTSSALRAELKAANLFGLSAAVVPFIGRPGNLVRPFERRAASLIDALGVTWLTGDQVTTCDILLAHHPQVFEHMPASAVRVRPQHVVCVVHHPPFNGDWKPQYDFEVVERNLERLFGAPVTFGPVGPKVRAQFESLVGRKPALLSRDLFNMIDISEWNLRQRPAPQCTATLGRHSRPDPLKWPDSRDELLAAYPDRRHLTIRALGGIPAELEAWIGSNWQPLPFCGEGVPDFLNSLDFYVYFHSRHWVEAFGMSVAEAMASGLVTVLDPSYETLFEDGAIYAQPNDVETVIDRFLASPDEYLKQSAAARKLVETKFSLATYCARMGELCDHLGLPHFPTLKAVHRLRLRGKRKQLSPSAGIPAPGTCRIAKRRRILFVATNGIGLGHITRLMAIAERMSCDVEPIFFTRSAGSALLNQRGHATDYIPWTVKVGVTDESWNRAYGQELLATIENLDIAAVVFDGTYPFRGLLAVESIRPDLAWVWVRRALWVNGQPLDETLQQHFHMVIEPGELAHDEDHGPTSRMPAPAHRVSTILLNDPRTGLSREDSAARLGADPGKFTVAIQLGSQRNFDYEALPDLLVKELVERGLQVVKIENPLARPSEKKWPGVANSTCYPIADCLSAIDLMITNAGYNSFHECVYGGVPTIFVPNESPEMDDQQLRAAYAHATGLGLRLRAAELGRVREIVDIALSDDFRAELRRRSARLEFVNGAFEAARIIEELVFSVRTNVPLHASLARA